MYPIVIVVEYLNIWDEIYGFIYYMNFDAKEN